MSIKLIYTDKIRPLFDCDHCGKSYKNKVSIVKHLKLHNGQEITNTGHFCTECNLSFKNKGLLMIHRAKVHLPKSKNLTRTIENQYKTMCQACQINFFHPKDLKYHIRENHFNLKFVIPYCDLKKVNQVWFEKVLNSNNIIEIKKVAQNILLMRKLDDNTAMKVSSHSTEVVDLHHLYPTRYDRTVECHFCFKRYEKNYIRKHIHDLHNN